jgi:hypothetical protein
LRFSATRSSSALCVRSRFWNCDASVSPEYSSASSPCASASASIWSIFCDMRSKVSNALWSRRPLIVSWMAFCASARFFRAMRTFFLRLASSILSLSRRSAFLS